MLCNKDKVIKGRWCRENEFTQQAFILVRLSKGFVLKKNRNIKLNYGFILIINTTSILY